VIYFQENPTIENLSQCTEEPFSSKNLFMAIFSKNMTEIDILGQKRQTQ
jgi:hypothetical protein